MDNSPKTWISVEACLQVDRELTTNTVQALFRKACELCGFPPVAEPWPPTFLAAVGWAQRLRGCTSDTWWLVPESSSHGEVVTVRFVPKSKLPDGCTLAQAQACYVLEISDSGYEHRRWGIRLSQWDQSAEFMGQLIEFSRQLR